MAAATASITEKLPYIVRSSFTLPQATVPRRLFHRMGQCDRSGGFEPLRFLPKGKHLVLGLVTSKTGVLESKDDLKRRIDEASRFVPLDQLCLSPQCGFASTEEGNTLAEEEQWAKLAMIVEVAREVWG